MVPVVNCGVKGGIFHLIVSQLYCLWEVLLTENLKGQKDIQPGVRLEIAP